MSRPPVAISTIVSTPLRDVKVEQYYEQRRLRAPSASPLLGRSSPAWAQRNAPPASPLPGRSSPAQAQRYPSPASPRLHGSSPARKQMYPLATPPQAGGSSPAGAQTYPPSAPPLAGGPRPAGGHMAQRHPPSAAQNASNNNAPLMMPEKEQVDPCVECFGPAKGRPMYDEHEVALIVKRAKRPSACSTYADPEALRALFTWEPHDGNPSSAKPQEFHCRSVRRRSSYTEMPLAPDEMRTGTARYLRVRTSKVKRMSECSTRSSDTMRASISSGTPFMEASLMRFGPNIAEWTVTQPKRLNSDYCIDACFYKCPPCAR